MMLSNCGAGEDSCPSPLDYKKIKPVNPKKKKKKTTLNINWKD